MKKLLLGILVFVGLFLSFSIFPVYAITPDSGWSLSDYTHSKMDCTIPLSGAGGPLEPGLGCDIYSMDLYERPTIQEPDSADPSHYYPFIDIEQIMVGEGTDFFYFAIDLVDTDQNGDLAEFYACEIDFDNDQRGDYLLEVHGPKDTKHKSGWTQKDLFIWYDENNDVGGDNPNIPEGLLYEAGTVSFDGYEIEYWVGEDTETPSTDNAWVRISPEDTTVVEFALKKSYIGNLMTARLRGWAMKGTKDEDEFYFHDRYGGENAGSPYSANTYFPCGDIYEVDNTRGIGNFFVVPEIPFGTITALIVPLVALVVYKSFRKTRYA